jgi:hypothetical protein
MSEESVRASNDETVYFNDMVRARIVRNASGKPIAIEWMHDANAGFSCDRRWDWLALDDGWTLVNESPLTVSPSLLCRCCGRHGFIREGQWVRA